MYYHFYCYTNMEYPGDFFWLNLPHRWAVSKGSITSEEKSKSFGNWILVHRTYRDLCKQVQERCIEIKSKWDENVVVVFPLNAYRESDDGLSATLTYKVLTLNDRELFKIPDTWSYQDRKDPETEEYHLTEHIYYCDQYYEELVP